MSQCAPSNAAPALDWAKEAEGDAAADVGKTKTTGRACHRGANDTNIASGRSVSWQMQRGGGWQQRGRGGGSGYMTPSRYFHNSNTGAPDAVPAYYPCRMEAFITNVAYYPQKHMEQLPEFLRRILCNDMDIQLTVELLYRKHVQMANGNVSSYGHYSYVFSGMAHLRALTRCDAASLEIYRRCDNLVFEGRPLKFRWDRVPGAPARCSSAPRSATYTDYSGGPVAEQDAGGMAQQFGAALAVSAKQSVDTPIALEPTAAAPVGSYTADYAVAQAAAQWANSAMCPVVEQCHQPPSPLQHAGVAQPPYYNQHSGAPMPIDNGSQYAPMAPPSMVMPLGGQQPPPGYHYVMYMPQHYHQQQQQFAPSPVDDHIPQLVPLPPVPVPPTPASGAGALNAVGQRHSMQYYYGDQPVNMLAAPPPYNSNNN